MCSGNFFLKIKIKEDTFFFKILKWSQKKKQPRGVEYKYIIINTFSIYYEVFLSIVDMKRSPDYTQGVSRHLLKV